MRTTVEPDLTNQQLITLLNENSAIIARAKARHTTKDSEGNVVPIISDFAWLAVLARQDVQHLNQDDPAVAEQIRVILENANREPF